MTTSGLYLGPKNIFISMNKALTFNFWMPLGGSCHFPVVQTVKSLPAKWETQVPSLGQEDPLEKGMAAHSSILAWRIPWTGQPGGQQSMRS